MAKVDPASRNFALGIGFRMDPPVGLTDTGRLRQLSSNTLNLAEESLTILLNERVAQLRAVIVQSYRTKWATGETAAGIQVQKPTISGGGVEGGITLRSSALPFVTSFGSGLPPLPAMDIVAKGRNSKGQFKKGFMVWRAPWGEMFRARKVHHPGFAGVGDPIAAHMAAIREEVVQVVLASVSRATLTWADESNRVTSQNVRRQYRYSTKAGRPTKS